MNWTFPLCQLETGIVDNGANTSEKQSFGVREIWSWVSHLLCDLVNIPNLLVAGLLEYR